MKKVIASGPVIVEDGRILVIKDNKDDFYKIPGGTAEEQDQEDLEKTCEREFKEETAGKLKITRKLSTQILNKNSQTNEEMIIELHHYFAELLNKDELKPIQPVQEIQWLDLEEIKQEKHSVAPNIKFLIESGDLG